MSYKDFVDNFGRLACVIAVNLTEEDDSRRYILVDANDAYKRSVVKNIEDFETGVPYTRYIPKTANFEALAESCVRSNKPIHTYFDTDVFNAWMEVYMMPLVSEDPDRGLLLFSYEMNQNADVDKMTDISSETASNVLKMCLKLRETTDFQKAMDSVVEDIREYCGAKSCRILLTDFPKKQCSLLSEAYVKSPEMKPMSEYLTDDFFSIVETWPSLINNSNCCVITGQKDMDRAEQITPAWVAFLKTANVERLVIFPLRSGEETLGYFWVINFDVNKTMMIRETLNLMAFLLSAEIANELNIRKMKIMSSTDLLTGVFNRNAMNNRISDDRYGTSIIEKPFGVFFIDVNGLKTTNDTKGHIEGDKLLQDVASALKELAAPNNEIYRVGGDEFMIIAVKTTAAEFAEMEQTLRSQSERPNRAHFAVGGCHSDEAVDIIKAMQTADARMYVVKEEYYARHPEYEWYKKPM